jgi:hypothetical protein
MLEMQIWKYKFRFTNFGHYSGLFGLYGLEGQTKGIPQLLTLVDYNGEKIMKIQFFPYLAFGVTFKTFFGLFKIFLRSLMLRQSAEMDLALCTRK